VFTKVVIKRLNKADKEIIYFKI